jgi:ABC-2 type transport system permease protein
MREAKMDVPAVKITKINRWLPYWAVFQSDVRQTTQSWVYRTWVLASLLAIAGYLIFRYGPYHEAGLVQSAAGFFGDLLRWTVLGSAAVVVVLAGSSISAERGTMADSVLSRGISRYQYFLGKWHARLVTVLGTYLALGLLAMTCGLILFQEDLSLAGGLVALATVAVLLAVVITCGVTVSAIANSTVVGIAVLWLLLYGGGFALSLFPAAYLTPDRILQRLPHVLRGYYNLDDLGRLVGWSCAFSFGMAVVGMGYFARRDV